LSAASVTWNVPLDVNVWIVYSPTVVTVPPVAREFPEEEHEAATEFGALEFGAPAAGDGAAGDATP
jgi:hypothetical protein